MQYKADTVSPQLTLPWSSARCSSSLPPQHCKNISMPPSAKNEIGRGYKRLNTNALFHLLPVLSSRSLDAHLHLHDDFLTAINSRRWILLYHIISAVYCRPSLTFPVLACWLSSIVSPSKVCKFPEPLHNPTWLRGKKCKDRSWNVHIGGGGFKNKRASGEKEGSWGSRVVTLTALPDYSSWCLI